MNFEKNNFQKFHDEIKKDYSMFLFFQEKEGQKHFSAHSHHYWPNISRQAQIDYWDHSAQFVDDKWNDFFQGLILNLEKQVKSVLSAPKEQDDYRVIFGQNTHELFLRLLSCLFSQQKRSFPIKVLTSNSEFHSFKRQIQLLAQTDMVEVDYIDASIEKYSNRSLVNTELFYTEFQQDLERQLKASLSKNTYQFILLSHTFFDSGLRISRTALEMLNNFAQQYPESIIVVDLYHSYCAINLIEELQDSFAFLCFTGGSYKYAQGGEGACFLTIPKSFRYAPLFSGWFAEFDQIEERSEHSAAPWQSPDIFWRFQGATQDYSALFRSSAVLSWLLAPRDKNIINYLEATRNYCEYLNQYFMRELRERNINIHKYLVANDSNTKGRFLSFFLDNELEASKLVKELRAQKIITDCRGRFFRVCFAPYHSLEDINHLIDFLK